MAGLVLALLGALLLLPSSPLQRFDGLPLGSVPEFTALALLLPLLASRVVRRVHRRAFGRGGPRLRRALFGAGLLALGLKLVLLGAGVHESFLACYRTPLGPPPAGACERSWENPFFRFAATRLDRAVDFAPGRWNLSFVNSLRFNFYAEVPGKVRRDRLPIEATWRGDVERSEPWVARVTYVGRATVSIGPATRELPTRYDGPATVRLEVPAGRYPLAVRYGFDDGSRTQGPLPSGPYATLRIARERPAGGEARLRAARAAWGWRAAAWVADGLLGALVGWVLVVLASVVRRAWPALVVGAAVGIFGVLVPVLPRLADAPAVLAAQGLLLIALLASNRSRTRLALFFAALGLAVVMAAHRVGAHHVVLSRSAGDDWLTYESYARTILESGSLQGGESVFRNQPLFRYVLFGVRLLLGDGELASLAWGLTALVFGVLWAVGRFAGRRRPRGRTAVYLGVGLLLLAVVNSAPVVSQVLAPLSEPATWIALVFAFPLLLASDSARAWGVGAALAGLSIATRPNQAPGTILLLGAFLATALPLRPRAALVAAGLSLAAALLPLAHNLYYGGRWVLFTTTAAVPATLALPPARWPALLHDPGARALAWTQVQHLVFWLPQQDQTLDLAVHGLQAAWLLAIAMVGLRRVRASAPTVVLLALPAVYLAVHFAYDATSYFPRHVIVGYLAMGLVALYVAGRPARPRSGAESAASEGPLYGVKT